MNRDAAQVLEQIKNKIKKIGAARFLYALNTALLNTIFSLSGTSPKYRSFDRLTKKNQMSSVFCLFCGSSVKSVKFLK